jgi:hypothetical protein
MRPLALALAALPFAPANSVPAQNCVGPLTRTTLPTLGSSPFYPSFVKVDGDDAVVHGHVAGNQSLSTALCALHRDSATGTWQVDFIRRYTGYADDPHHVALRGGMLVYSQRRNGSADIVVLTRSPTSGAWEMLANFTDPTHNFGAPPAVHASEVLVAFRKGQGHEVWRRVPGGLQLAGRFSTTFQTPFALSGERIAIGREAWVELYCFPASGGSLLEAVVTAPAGYNLLNGHGSPRLEGDRLLTYLMTDPPNTGIAAIALWRILPTASGTTLGLEGLQAPDIDSSVLQQFQLGTLRGDTLVDGVVGNACVVGEYVRHARVSDISDAGVLALRGRVCDFGGMSPRELEHVGYDGRTLAFLFRGDAPSVGFAPMLAIAHDRDRDCVEDVEQIHADPSLDRNFNGRLDSTELVGEEFCGQTAPNSTGAFAELTLLGTPSAASQDLLAVSEHLRPFAVGMTLVSFAPMPLPALASTASGLCLGGGNLGRHPALQADMTGTAVTQIRPAALPAPGGVWPSIAGQTLSWQHVYRDGVLTRATPAVALQLW